MKRSREPEGEAEPSTPGSDLGGPASREGSEPAPKVVGLDPAEESSTPGVAMRCSLPPHAEVLIFRTYDEFETHYNRCHTNRCLECRKSFPSQHLLGLHIEESHDAFTAVKREKGEHTYTCFVESCERKCRTPQKRRLHLIDKHMYPKNYFFAVTRDGVDGRRSMLLEGGHRRRRSSIATKDSRRASLMSTKTVDDGASTDGEASTGAAAGQTQHRDVEMDGLSEAVSALQFTPPSVRFGRGGKAGFQKR